MRRVPAPFAAPDLPTPQRERAGATAGSGRPSWLRVVAEALFAPTAAALRRWAMAGVITSVLIILTGAAVRLSQSGLGCPDWPACTAHSLGAAGTTGDPLVHRWIEFGNRLVTVAIFVVAIGVCIAVWQFRTATGQPGGSGRRRDLVWLAAAQPAAILVQALLGGLVVLTKLNPALVSLHFLASSALVAATVALYLRCQEGTGSARPLVRAEVRLLGYAMVGVVALMLAAGTVVTGTGPLAGARNVARYHLPLEGVTQLHADIGWLLGGLAIALVVALRIAGAPARARQLGWLLLAMIGVQGVIGYAQYFSGLPAGLVWVHVAGSTVIWVTALALPYSLRDRGQVTEPAGQRAAAAVS
jgi:heme a synthase